MRLFKNRLIAAQRKNYQIWKKSVTVLALLRMMHTNKLFPIWLLNIILIM